MTFASSLQRACLALALMGLWNAHTLAAEPADSPAAAPKPPIQANRAASSPLPLKPTSATYTASLDKGIAISGSATRSLEPQKDGTWILRSKVDSFIVDIRESLHFRWQDNQVIPLTYRYRLSGFLIRDRENSLDYDWDKARVSGTMRGKSFTIDLSKGDLDPLGYQLQLRQDLSAGKTDMIYQVTGKGGFDEAKFSVIGEQKLKTNLGTLDTIKATKVRAPDSKRETLMWFAPARDYLLVKLVQVEPDGTRYELNIQKADLSP